MDTWATVAVAAGTSVVTTLAYLLVQDWRYRPRPIAPEQLAIMGDAFRAGLGVIREAVPRPDVDSSCTGAHTCRPGHLPVSWCRESCSLCSGDDVRPCYADHRRK